MLTGSIELVIDMRGAAGCIMTGGPDITGAFELPKPPGAPAFVGLTGHRSGTTGLRLLASAARLVTGTAGQPVARTTPTREQTVAPS